MELYCYPEVWEFMKGCAEKAGSDEVGGYGYLTVDEEQGFIIVDDAFLVPQVVSPGEVDLEELQGSYYALEKAANEKRVNDMRFWWHSHGSGTCFRSGTDNSTIDKYGWHVPWYVTLITNRNGDVKVWLDQWNLPLVGHAIWDLDFKVLRNRDLSERINDGFEQHVLTRSQAWKIKSDKRGPLVSTGVKGGTTKDGTSYSTTGKGKEETQETEVSLLPGSKSILGMSYEEWLDLHEQLAPGWYAIAGIIMDADQAESYFTNMVADLVEEEEEWLSAFESLPTHEEVREALEEAATKDD